jgi:hypothetical protein
MAPKNSLFGMYTVISIAVAQGGVPVRAPRIQFKTTGGIMFTWHRVFNSSIVEVESPVTL